MTYALGLGEGKQKLFKLGRHLQGFLTLSAVCPVASDGTAQGEKEKEERPPELPLLSEQLSLDELWDMLGECLKELEESHDQHAVLGEYL
jgi:hypothetical protein